MDATSWAMIRDAFTQVEEAPPADRLAILETLPAEVRAEVESLLAALAAAGGFLTPPDESDLGPGQMVGPYRLVDELGRGGMGVVYRAERSDGEFRREVALKIAGGAMPGLENERRLIRERQLLASLDHPGIVRMIDGGVSAGSRYFAMELVRGSPITEYCANRGLDIGARLRLFRDVCSAVSHAHQHLVLHRDLKPGNILVTAEGGVRVLDFGLARLVDPDSPEATAPLLQPLSLFYASPEQLRRETLTLASDIYALGLLLYELLTGVNPRQVKGPATRRRCGTRWSTSRLRPAAWRAASCGIWMRSQARRWRRIRRAAMRPSRSWTPTWRATLPDCRCWRRPRARATWSDASCAVTRR